jgi:hypothetical protein
LDIKTVSARAISSILIEKDKDPNEGETMDVGLKASTSWVLAGEVTAKLDQRQ